MMLKLTAAAALLAASLSASAMTSIADEDLSAVAGQDGVSIAADLNINIGAFTYSDGAANVSFNSITVRGMMVLTIDVLGASAFQSAAGAALVGNGLALANVSNVLTEVAAATGWTGQDVVQFAFPAVGTDSHSVTPTITVGSITTGKDVTDASGNVTHDASAGASFGSITIKNLDLQGTKVWMYGH
jgi:hypothetical protein